MFILIVWSDVVLVTCVIFPSIFINTLLITILIITIVLLVIAIVLVVTILLLVIIIIITTFRDNYMSSKIIILARRSRGSYSVC